MKRFKRENQSQKNLEVNLSSAQQEIAEWLDNLSEKDIDRLEWLIDEVDYLIDSMQLQQTGFKEAKTVLERFLTKNVL